MPETESALPQPEIPNVRNEDKNPRLFSKLRQVFVKYPVIRNSIAPLLLVTLAACSQKPYQEQHSATAITPSPVPEAAAPAPASTEPTVIHREPGASKQQIENPHEATGTKKGSFVQIINETGKGYDQEPVEKTSKHIEALQNKMPLLGQIEIRISPRPSSFNVQTDKAIIYLTPENPAVTYPLPPKDTAHELSHALDINLNLQRLIPYLTPDQVEKLMVEREQIIRQFAPNYSDLAAFLGRDTNGFLVNNPQITAKDLSTLSTTYPDSIWLLGKNVKSESKSPPQAFDKFLQNPAFATLKATDSTTPFDKLLDSENTNLDALAASSPFWQRSIEAVRENPSLFTSFTDKTGFLPRGNYAKLQVFANLILRTDFLNNRQETLNLVKDADKPLIKSEIKRLVDEANTERFAEIFGYYIDYREKVVPDTATKSLDNYLNLMATSN